MDEKASFLCLSDSQPHGLIPFFGFGDVFLQAVKPEAAIKHLAYFAVLPHEDATLSVLLGVARMDAHPPATSC